MSVKRINPGSDAAPGRHVSADGRRQRRRAGSLDRPGGRLTCSDLHDGCSPPVALTPRVGVVRSGSNLVKVAPTALDLSKGLFGYNLDFPGDALSPGCTYEEWAHRVSAGGVERGPGTWGAPVLSAYYKDSRGPTLVQSHKMLAFLPMGEKTLVCLGKAGIDFKTVKGSGPGGRIVKRDIESAISDQEKPAATKGAVGRISIPRPGRDDRVESRGPEHLDDGRADAGGVDGEEGLWGPRFWNRR